MVDRNRDLADIFTATVGTGTGGKARLGPLSAGLFANSDYCGLRGGVFLIKDESSYVREYTSFIPAGFILPIFLEEEFIIENELTIKRHKNFKAIEVFPFITYKAIVPSTRPQQIQLPYYTQCEVAFGFLGNIRLGFNIGEFFDYILGWTTLDIYNDDIGIIKNEKIEQNKSPNSESTKKQRQSNRTSIETNSRELKNNS
jgi:hypothetical protein